LAPGRFSSGGFAGGRGGRRRQGGRRGRGREDHGALAAKDAKAAAELYATDAVFAASGFGTVKGHDAIAAALTQFLKDATFTVKETSTDFQVDPNGSIAYLVASYEMTQTPPGATAPVTVTGTNVTVYRKDASGTWQITADMNIDDRHPHTEIC
jgi:uncharacterized protein (TIGR02246 family)